MTTLTVTARGQVTLKKELLQHLGIGPGDKIELQLLPDGCGMLKAARPAGTIDDFIGLRSEEHTSELQSLMRISYAVFCLKKKTQPKHTYWNLGIRRIIRSR